jgi:AcrR family transcriptional regulator
MSRGNLMARTPLTRERIIDAAMGLADEVGLEALSMRKLGDRLGVEAMSLYNHVANKDDLLDGMADAFMASIDIPSPGDEWKEAMRLRANSAREQFARHRWALSLIESRPNAGFETIRYHDAIIGVLREAGFSIEMTAHAFALLDAFIFGFALQERNIPVEGPEEVGELAAQMMAALPMDQLPHFAEFVTEHALQPGYDFGDEFAWGLEAVLDQLEHRAFG